MPTPPTPPSDGRDHRRGLVAVLAALGAVAIGMTAGVTRAPGDSPAAGAADWVRQERPAGRVLTVDGWDRELRAGGRLTVVTGAEDELAVLAISTGPGSVVVPADADAVTAMRRSGDWTLSYRDDAAVVLVHRGALPVDGAT